MGTDWWKHSTTATITALDSWQSNFRDFICMLTFITSLAEQNNKNVFLIHCIADCPQPQQTDVNKELLQRVSLMHKVVCLTQGARRFSPQKSQMPLIYLTDTQKWYKKKKEIASLLFSSWRLSMCFCLIFPALSSYKDQFWCVCVSVWASLQYTVLGLPVPFEMNDWIILFEMNFRSTFLKGSRHVSGDIHE